MSEATPKNQKKAGKSGEKVDVGSSEMTTMNGNNSAKFSAKKRKRKGPNEVSPSPAPNQSTNAYFDQTLSPTPSTPIPNAKKAKLNKNGITPKNEQSGARNSRSSSNDVTMSQDDVGVILITCTQISSVHYLRVVKEGQSWKQTLDFIRRKWPQLADLKDYQIQFTCQFSNKTMSVDEKEDFEAIVSLAITKGTQPEDPLTLDVKPNMDGKPKPAKAAGRKGVSKAVQSEVPNTPANAKKAAGTNTPTTWNISIEVPTPEENAKAGEEGAPKVETNVAKQAPKKAAKRKSSPNQIVERDMSLDTDAEDLEVQNELGLADDVKPDQDVNAEVTAKKPKGRKSQQTSTEAIGGDETPAPAKTEEKGAKKARKSTKAQSGVEDKSVATDSVEEPQPVEIEIAKVIEGGMEKVTEWYEKLKEKAELTSNELDARNKFGEWLDNFRSQEAQKAEDEKKQKEAEEKALKKEEEKKRKAQEAEEEKKKKAQEAEEEKKRKALEAEEEKKRKAQEADEEKKRKAQEAEEEKKRKAQEAEEEKKRKAQEADEEKKRKAQEAEEKKKAVAEEKQRKKDELAKQKAEEKAKKEAEAAAKKEEAAAKRKAAAEEKERKQAAIKAKKESDRQELEELKRKAAEEEAKKKKEDQTQTEPAKTESTKKEAENKKDQTSNGANADDDSSDTSSSSSESDSDDSSDSDSDSESGDSSETESESEKKKASNAAPAKTSSPKKGDTIKGKQDNKASSSLSFGYPRLSALDPSKIKVSSPQTPSIYPAINGKKVTDDGDSSEDQIDEDDDDDSSSDSSSSSDDSSSDEDEPSSKNTKASNKQTSSIPQTKRAGAKAVNQKSGKGESSKKQKSLLSKLAAKSS
ncbi:uncharacterized protein FA14DRAFT_81032 [Meira miltonrushii]|uniref:Uncharacterized protein n=1 Tax=Meira miltonrushii TaxID=1280837 RepID=A0A316V6D2_9BASI|nr:uncharacterized protein FA14DRAFT_81032 [Meira miltonrushii]PWN33066.1 hypothetical protein FA14DRAFT_81032 [Meira miltonrushii]